MSARKKMYNTKYLGVKILNGEKIGRCEEIKWIKYDKYMRKLKNKFNLCMISNDMEGSKWIHELKLLIQKFFFVFFYNM